MCGHPRFGCEFFSTRIHAAWFTSGVPVASEISADDVRTRIRVPAVVLESWLGASCADGSPAAGRPVAGKMSFCAGVLRSTTGSRRALVAAKQPAESLGLDDFAMCQRPLVVPVDEFVPSRDLGGLPEFGPRALRDGP